jgi:uncharacterized OsmC-like protein
VLDADHPKVFTAQDRGATPVEIALAAPAACRTAAVESMATNRGVQLRAITATVAGDMDIQGILGIDPDVHNGFGGIRVRYEVDADAARADIEAIVAQSQKRSAVFDLVANSTNVTVELARTDTARR